MIEIVSEQEITIMLQTIVQTRTDPNKIIDFIEKKKEISKEKGQPFEMSSTLYGFLITVPLSVEASFEIAINLYL